MILHLLKKIIYQFRKFFHKIAIFYGFDTADDGANKQVPSFLKLRSLFTIAYLKNAHDVFIVCIIEFL